jgi:hypothetical protein
MQMKKVNAGKPVFWLLVCLFLVFSVSAGRAAVDSATIKPLFAKPPREYSTSPFWVWNDMLSDELITSTLRDLAGQKIRQLFIHPRPGLMTPYLSDEWFRLWKLALQEAQRLDMNLWIYDENSYPSGFAGGLVPDAMPQARGQSLQLRQQQSPNPQDTAALAVFSLTDDNYCNVTDQLRAGQALPAGRYLAASLQPAVNSPWFAGKCYVDLLNPSVTPRFLSVTFDAYARHLGHQFGKRVPGCFTDEPHLLPAGALPWTADLPEVFQERWQYSLIDHLPALVSPLADYKRIRHNYLQVLLDLFIERWAKPYYDYCEQHNLELTGHYWEHEWPNCLPVPDNMALGSWQQRPGIDILMNQYSEDTHAQFGNVRAVKELSSVANQLGRRRTLCEAYGAAGWDLRFEDMKRIGDWLYALGVNTLNEHLSYVSIRGARKRDHPPSFSYHSPWWRAYHVMIEYFTRLSLVLSQGEQVNHILVLEPTTTAWMYQADAGHRTQLDAIGSQFQQTLLSLERAQLEYDLGCEEIIARHGSVRGPLLTIGQRSYHTVVLPALTENLNRPTMDLLEAYLKAAGTVLCCGPAPARQDGQLSNRGSELARFPGWRQIQPEQLVELLKARSDVSLTVRQNENDAGILLHHRRQLDDGDFLFLVNTSIDSPAAGTVHSTAGSIERWDPQTANIAAYLFEKTDQGIQADFELPPAGSLLLFVSKKPKNPPLPELQTISIIPPVDQLQTQRLQPNVLTLDYVDITTAGQTQKGLYFYEAEQHAFAANAMERNPWDGAVQFRDEVIKKQYPPNNGFEATYCFELRQQVPRLLHIVIERPDLYSITCNGQPVSATKGSWWLDRSFGKIDIRAQARIGHNAVTIKACPMTIYHELEPAYLLGSFVLEPSDSGFIIRPEPNQPLDLGQWNNQGHPFYSGEVCYTQKFNIPQPAGQYYVTMARWYGSVAEVVVNGRSAGYIACQPWQKDVTLLLQPGLNTIQVIVIGSLKNTLGPHHAAPVLGAAWPSMFQQAPHTGPPAGNQYHTVGYGLLEQFILQHIAKPAHHHGLTNITSHPQ